LSPQNRRGRATPPAHGRPAPKKPVAATPPASPKPAAAEEPIETVSAAARPRRTTPGVRRRGLARVQRSSMLRNAFEYVRSYIPLFAAFVLVFGGVWAWISFGPHTPSPKERWTQIEQQWRPRRDADLALIGANVNNFDAQVAAYKSLHDDMKSWMDALSAVSDWVDARASDNTNLQVAQDVGAFVSVGNSEITVLAVISNATSANDVLGQQSTLNTIDGQFEQAYETVYIDFYQRNLSSTGPTMAFPPGTYVPTPSPAPSVTPGPSATPAASPSPSPSPAVSPKAS
jgi:hypothetical protein